jgi:hypothetical protein
MMTRIDKSERGEGREEKGERRRERGEGREDKGERRRERGEGREKYCCWEDDENSVYIHPSIHPSVIITQGSSLHRHRRTETVNIFTSRSLEHVARCFP